MFFAVVLGCFLLVNTMISESYCMTADQKAMVHKHFEEIGAGCIKDNAISSEDIENLRAKKLPTGENAPCFMACMFNKMGLMNDSGLFQKETALELAKKVFNDSEEIKILEDYLHSCAHVNTESVGDGDKGCERAILGYKCMMENASKFGFEL